MITKKFLLTFLSLIAISDQSSIECGVAHIPAITDRVSGGRIVGRFDHPWKAALMTSSDNGEEYNYICGGVLIDDETVVTAAHCLRQTNDKSVQARDLMIALGAHNISKKIEPERYYALVKSIKIHDNWNTATTEHDGDIAVIKLTKPVIFDEYIRPVCLVTENLLSIKNGSVVGWRNYNDRAVPSDLPRKTDIPIVDKTECFRRDGDLASINWDEAFCAGKEGAGVCEEDSGTGFYVQEGGKVYLRGIVSSVARSCSEANLALYSGIFLYMNFIGKFMKPGTSNDRDDFHYQNVQAECCGDCLPYGYTCYIGNLNVNVPNFRIGNIATQHDPGYSDQDVKAIYIWKSNFKYLPTFEDEFLTMKVPNVKQLIFDGAISSVPLNFHSTQDKSAIPSEFESFGLIKFGDKIKKLPTDFLTKSPQLKEFSVYDNEIEEIDANFFAKNANMTKVDIDKNRIKQLPASLLLNLEELTHFDANENEIASIPRDFFHRNPKLEEVHLYVNQITSLPDDLFMNNKNLKSIYIGDNKIKTLPPNLIANAPFLTEFSATSNGIEVIPSNFTKNNPELKFCKIS